MTRNQLEYWKNEETKRHNLALEEQGLIALRETQRSNMASEAINQQSVSENERSNRARELEAHRANLAQEYQNLIRYQETVRSNMANEAIGRQNVSLGWANVAVAQQNADINDRNAVTNRLNAWSNDVNTQRRNDIQAASNPFVNIASQPNLLTNLKSFVTLVGQQIVQGTQNLIKNSKPAPVYNKPSVQSISKPPVYNVFDKYTAPPKSSPKPSYKISMPTKYTSGTRKPR